MATNNKQVTGWVGWIVYASILMILGGLFQSIIGLTAIFHDKFYVAASNTLVVLDVTTWGWIHFLMGLVVLIAGFALLQGRTWARILAVVLVVLSAVANLAFIPYYPIWSVIVIVIDVLVIYALVAHGDELSE